MSIEQAIRDARKAGYPHELDWDFGVDTIFLDPIFWQSLGKGIGWSEVNELGDRFTHLSPKEIQDGYPHGLVMRAGRTQYTHFNYEQEKQFEWLYQWHRFIDHLAAGKTAQSFFAKL